jgi:hypothetical protein
MYARHCWYEKYTVWNLKKKKLFFKPQLLPVLSSTKNTSPLPRMVRHYADSIFFIFLFSPICYEVHHIILTVTEIKIIYKSAMKTLLWRRWISSITEYLRHYCDGVMDMRIVYSKNFWKPYNVTEMEIICKKNS